MTLEIKLPPKWAFRRQFLFFRLGWHRVCPRCELPLLKKLYDTQYIYEIGANYTYRFYEYNCQCGYSWTVREKSVEAYEV